MARCLPFPPPGYEWNGKCGEDLLELIKVQRERVKAEREMKKEKKRKKHHKKKAREEGDKIWVEKHGHKLLKRRSNDEIEGRGKHTEYETQEQAAAERSSLSEELEQPVSDNLDASSDNSQSIQRKRRMISRSCNDQCHNHGIGSIVQIDFHHQKHNIPEALLLAPSPLKAHLPTCTAQGSSIDANDKSALMAPMSGRSATSLCEIESKYTELVEKWVPPSLYAEPFDIGDEDWLFKKKQPRSQITGTNTARYDVLHQGNFTHYPCAQYLPKADIYALPYTIPY